ncbi:amidohydrolase family protein [Rhizorhabdus wittichii]|uniref:Amidohydrolase family protein n=1 Tax=Rhizorhabdus wittichii TaxID=160791 RepID=A0A975D5D0_9SPHN|nr:amidohydrolase family protein [Rhizorhabdus wittichii]QTH23211.1 amidohydrolase family protein [Rhizorhabdus wittichii]
MRRADVGIRGNLVAAVGSLDGRTAVREIDADGRTVAPGFVDQHTHYDAQLFWDPYCSNSGEHATTTAVTSNCGFGIAPCRAADRERVMAMLENTEEIRVEHLRSALPWDWETWPELKRSMERTPKGINITSLVPMNPLMLWAMGDDAIKARRPNAAEIDQMRAILGEALDAGAAGLSVSLMGDENTHRDSDGSPMPSDVMEIDDLAAVCRAMTDRGRGMIQTMAQAGPTGDRTRSERIARATRRPVVHNFFMAGPQGDAGYREDIDWLDGLADEGLEMWAHAMVYPAWVESSLQEFNAAFGSHPQVNQMALCAGPEEICALIAQPGYREAFRDSYDPRSFSFPGGFNGITILADDVRGAADAYAGRTLSDIARDRGTSVVDALLDVILAGNGRLNYRTQPLVGGDPELSLKYLRHPRVLAGASDGGAHLKSVSMGCWTTWLLIEFVRNRGAMSIEEMHYQLSFKPARALGFTDRGEIAVGKAADIVIYDLDDLYFDAAQYDRVFDMPDGDWRKLARAGGYSCIIVNGEITHEKDKSTGATPGRYVIPA